MSFYTYTYLQQNRVIIHRGSCFHARDGQGNHGKGDDQETGGWSEAFESYDKAKQSAGGFSLSGEDSLADVANCQDCAPHLADDPAAVARPTRPSPTSRPARRVSNQRICPSCHVFQPPAMFNSGSDECRDCQ